MLPLKEMQGEGAKKRPLRCGGLGSLPNRSYFSLGKGQERIPPSMTLTLVYPQDLRKQ